MNCKQDTRIEEILTGDIIKERRLELDLSQKEMAQFCGVAQGTVSAWENNKKHPSRNNIEKITEFLDLKFEDLYFKEEERMYTKQELALLKMLDKKASVELTDAQIIKMFNFSVDGRPATKEEIISAITYIRVLRQTTED